MQFYRSLEVVIKVTNVLVKFPGEGNAALWVFQRCVCTVVSCAALGYCYSWPNFNPRRQDVVECTWKSKNSRYRHVVPDLPAKSSSLNSSIARHWGQRTKSIARWGNKIAFWGKQFKTITRCHTLFLYCYSCVLKMSLLFMNVNNLTL